MVWTLETRIDFTTSATIPTEQCATHIDTYSNNVGHRTSCLLSRNVVMAGIGNVAIIPWTSSFTSSSKTDNTPSLFNHYHVKGTHTLNCYTYPIIVIIGLAFTSTLNQNISYVHRSTMWRSDGCRQTIRL